jgi:hypothetical protein
MHLEMAVSLPAAEACDDHVATESPARSAIKSMLAIFMFFSFVACRRGAWPPLSQPVCRFLCIFCRNFNKSCVTGIRWASRSMLLSPPRRHARVSREWRQEGAGRRERGICLSTSRALLVDLGSDCDEPGGDLVVRWSVHPVYLRPRPTLALQDANSGFHGKRRTCQNSIRPSVA